MADRHGLPVAVLVERATPHKVTLVRLFASARSRMKPPGDSGLSAPDEPAASHGFARWVNSIPTVPGATRGDNENVAARRPIVAVRPETMPIAAPKRTSL